MTQSIFSRVNKLNAKIARCEARIEHCKEYVEGTKTNSRYEISHWEEMIVRNEVRIEASRQELEKIKAEVEQPTVTMDLQLLAGKKAPKAEKPLTEKQVGASIKKAQGAGFIVMNPCQAHMVNNLGDIFNDKFYMKENNKTDRIPVFNLPNIKVQVDLLQLIKNNPQVMDLIPEEEKERFTDFIEYMKAQPMCVNCQGCKNVCYNNKAYTQYQSKAVCDIRQLYRAWHKPHVVAGEIVQETINCKNARLNGSGEIHNQQILDMYVSVAKQNPTTSYYTYTKNFALIAGKKLPKNLVINLSMFGTEKQIEEQKELLPKNLNIFKAVTKEEMLEIKKDKKLAKFICHGESCSTCNLCTKKKGIVIYCEIH